MLESYENGYAVMTRELDAYSLQSSSLDTCKRYCPNDMVVAEQIPHVCGFSLRVRYLKRRGNKFLCYYKYSNVLMIGRLSLQIIKEYEHKNGKIVYDPTKD